MACLLETPIRMSVLSVSDLLQPPAWELGPSLQHLPQTRCASGASPPRVTCSSALGWGMKEGGRV